MIAGGTGLNIFGLILLLGGWLLLLKGIPDIWSTAMFGVVFGLICIGDGMYVIYVRYEDSKDLRKQDELLKGDERKQDKLLKEGWDA